MQFIMLILSMMILVGCGQKDYSPISHDNGITPYTSEFASKARSEGIPDKINKISFSFKNMANNILGTCTIMYKNHWTGTKYEEYEYGRKIEINPYWWERRNESQRYQLLTHELGHCSLNRNHTNSYLSSLTNQSRIKVSVMHFEELPDYDYQLLRNYYLDELFFPNDVNPLVEVAAITNASYEMFASSTDTSAASLARSDESLPIFIDPELDHKDCVKTEHLPAE